MPNGKPGDRPLTDILVQKRSVYGSEAGDLIRRIAELCSRRELEECRNREIGWSPDRNSIISKARTRHSELLHRAKTGRLGETAINPPLLLYNLASLADSALAAEVPSSRVIRASITQDCRKHTDDPAAVQGTEEQRLAEFRRVRDQLRALLRQFSQKNH